MSETTLSAVPRTVLRPEDSVRIPRTFRIDERDKSRASSEETRSTNMASNLNALPGHATAGGGPPENDSSMQPTKTAEKSPLTAEETIQKAREAVEQGRTDTQHVLAGSEAVSEVVRPKLTIDLGHSNIARIPEPVVDLIKDEVERLSLSHNQIWHIPYRFAECAFLRYLNIRTNVFREFPKAVCKLPLLEILDISRNKLRRVPDEIRQLTSLRVFSLMHNKVEELPFTLCEMNKLQVLKVAENPLRFRLRRAIDSRELELTTTSLNDNEKEIAMTAEIKRFLREERGDQIPATPAEAESGGETSESTIDTPKPLKRVLSSRFPVIPSTAGSLAESPVDLTIKSPAQGKPPPIPTRSHYRIASGQNNNATRRPGVSPLTLGSERNRSNSESILQATATPRGKRTQILRRERTELNTVEEKPSNRYSHLRGYSYASALRTKIADSSADSGGSSSPDSPRGGRRSRMAYVRRLSSLPEHKEEDMLSSPLLEGAKGILYALYQVHPQILTLINVAKTGEIRRNSLDVIFFAASTHIEQLNEVLESAGMIDEEERYHLEVIESNIKAACSRCIKSYTTLCVQLQQHISKIIAGSDGRYVRTIMLLLYGSIMEIRNACLSLGVEVRPKTTFQREENGMAYSTAEQTIRGPKVTSERSLSRPAPRLRSDTAIQHPTLKTFGNPASVMPPQQDQTYRPALNMTGSTIVGPGYTGASFASTITNGSTIDARSRSNSRATMAPMPSSVSSTPRSGDTFVVPPTTIQTSKINTLTGVSDAEEERLFEQVFLALTAAYDAALQSLPVVKRQFTRSLEAAEEGRAPKEVRELWSNLIYRCKTCMDVSEALHLRLVNMKVKDPVSGRNQRDFWVLCKTFMQSFVDLVIDMRDARGLQMLPTEAIIVLRPVQKASREAGKLIDASPWGFLADNSASATAAMLPPNQYPGQFYQIPVNNFYQQSSQQPGLLNGNGISPVSVPLPATPLSAALGPAVQATVPSTPASAYGDQFFAGNVFQRADSLLNMSQTGGAPIFNRRA